MKLANPFGPSLHGNVLGRGVVLSRSAFRLVLRLALVESSNAAQGTLAANSD